MVRIKDDWRVRGTDRTTDEVSDEFSDTCSGISNVKLRGRDNQSIYKPVNDHSTLSILMANVSRRLFHAR